MDACLTGQVVRVGQKQRRATAKDPWKNLQGAGRRLDGATTTATSATTIVVSFANVEHLTEDEQLAVTISASMAEATRATTTDATGVDRVSMNTAQTAVVQHPLGPTVRYERFGRRGASLGGTGCCRYKSWRAFPHGQSMPHSRLLKPVWRIKVSRCATCNDENDDDDTTTFETKTVYRW